MNVLESREACDLHQTSLIQPAATEGTYVSLSRNRPVLSAGRLFRAIDVSARDRDIRNAENEFIRVQVGAALFYHPVQCTLLHKVS
jgi:hypothetical protein